MFTRRHRRTHPHAWTTSSAHLKLLMCSASHASMCLGATRGSCRRSWLLYASRRPPGGQGNGDKSSANRALRVWNRASGASQSRLVMRCSRLRKKANKAFSGCIQSGATWLQRPKLLTECRRCMFKRYAHVGEQRAQVVQALLPPCLQPRRNVASVPAEGGVVRWPGCRCQQVRGQLRSDLH